MVCAGSLVAWVITGWTCLVESVSTVEFEQLDDVTLGHILCLLLCISKFSHVTK